MTRGIVVPVFLLTMLLSLAIYKPECMALGVDNEILSAGRTKNRGESRAHLKTSDSVLDIVNHPSFAGFGRLLLPWDNRDYDKTTRLNDVKSLLPYHSNIDPGTVVDAINHLIDESNDGKTIFHDFYTDQQKRDDPEKKNTGLFFHRGKRDAPFAVVSPGGGFSYVGSIHEGFPYALELSKSGYNAFVLKYRVGGEQRATEDLAAALSYIFENAEMLGVSAKDYSLWGSSAGARMAANIGSNGSARYGSLELPKPCVVVMAYTGHAGYSRNDPPTFVVQGENDGIVHIPTVERRIEAMRKAGIEVEYHKYRNVGHGFGLGVGTPADGWIEHAIRFFENHLSE